MHAGICTSICKVSRVQLFATPWTVAHQAPLSMELWREVGGGIGMGNTCKPMAISFQCMTKFTTKKKKKEYWSGLLFPTSGDLPDPGIGPTAPASWGHIFHL